MLYAAGTGAPEVALAAIAQARDARRPTLLVLDDADRAPAEVHAARARARAARSRACRRSCWRPARRRPRSRGSSRATRSRSSRSTPRPSRLIAGLYAPAGDGDAVPVETLLATSRGVARRVHEAASEWARREATRRVDAVAGRDGGRPQRGPSARGRADRQRRRPAVGARARPARRGADGEDAEATGGLPVQGPGDVRHRRRRVLLRARAARRRAGRAARRRAAARRGRPVRQRQVVRGQGRAAARARGRRAARQRRDGRAR